jgi:threonine synthase
MNFYSTNNKKHKVSLQEAVIQGLAPDQGLYMPETIPVLPEIFFQTLPEKTFPEIAFQVARNVLGKELPDADLKKMVDHTIQFDAPLVEVDKNIFALWAHTCV